MRHVTLGSIAILTSPLLDFLLRRYVPVPMDVYASSMVRTGLHTLVIIPLVSGMILYLVGYKKREVNLQEVKVTFILGIPLVLWGLYMSMWAIFFYNDMLEWSMNPGVRELTIMDHLEYATWGLMGFLWIASGLMFMGSFIKEYLDERVGKP